MSKPTGGSSSYYDLPAGATQLQDLIQYREMSHAQGEMFCALYRRKPGIDALYNAQKVAWYALSDLAHQIRRAIERGQIDGVEAKYALDSMAQLLDEARERHAQLSVLAALAQGTGPVPVVKESLTAATVPTWARPA